MKDIFNFANFNPQDKEAPPLLRYRTRDGQELSYRVYGSQNQERALFLIHGSSAQGSYFHQLATYLSEHEIGQVFVPNLRGHYQSGEKRGTCAYPEQLEDDLLDLMVHATVQEKQKFLIGHSSGGSLALRFAGGHFGYLIDGFVLLSPSIPFSKAMRSLTAGGWASIAFLKIALIKLLNLFHCTVFNHQKVIRFNKPKQFCDGTETLEYSYNLLTACQPHDFYEKDIAALQGRFILLCGSEDEIHNPHHFPSVMKDPGGSHISILEGVNHINLPLDPCTMEIVSEWIKSL